MIIFLFNHMFVNTALSPSSKQIPETERTELRSEEREKEICDRGIVIIVNVILHLNTCRCDVMS